MTRRETLKTYRLQVETLGNQLLEALTRAAGGDLEARVELPDDLPVLQAIGEQVNAILEDFGRQRRTGAARIEALEQALAARSAALDAAEADVQAAQKLYFEREWADYVETIDRRPGTASFLWQGEWRRATREALQNGRSVVRRPGQGEETGIAVPIRVGDESIGVLGFGGTEIDLEPDDLATLESIVEQVGLALENQRLFDQNQQALSETETLYYASDGLNRAQSIRDVLKVVGETLDHRGAESVSFLELEFNADGIPEWQEIKATWLAGEALEPLPDGSRFKISRFQLFEKILGENPQIALIDDIETDRRTRDDQNLRAIARQTGAKAMAFLPLSIGQRLIGIIAVQWTEVQKFTSRDSRFFNTLAAQVATAVDGLKLLEDAQERAAELAILADTQSRLSMAVNEDEILGAVTPIFAGAETALHYLETDGSGRPISLQTVSRWRDGRIQVKNPQLGQVRPAAEVDLGPIWLADGRQPIHIADLQADPRSAPLVGDLVEHAGTRATCAVPLRSGGRWQAILTISWAEPHELNRTEEALLRSLAEPLAAVIASRRAQAAQQVAQEQAAKLYEASRRINEAAGDLDQITAVIGEISGAGINRALLMEIDYNERREMAAVEVTGSWFNGQGTPPLEIGHRFTRSSFRSIRYILGQEALFAADLSLEGGLDGETRRLLEENEVRSLAILPLLSANEQIGTIVLQGDRPHDFSTEEMRMLRSLSPQIAVAVQNQRLLKEAQARARREQVLREVTEKVRNAPTVEMVLKTAAAEVGRVFGRKAMVYFNQNLPADPETKP